MNHICKLLLIWLLVAALPLQGSAAALNLSCGSTHSESMFSAGMEHAPVGMESEHHHDHALLHVHDAAQLHPSAQHAAADMPLHKNISDHAADPHQQHQHKDGSCSTCAACCFGTAALPSATIFSSASNGSDIVAVPPRLLADSHIPASLERPPRSIFS